MREKIRRYCIQIFTNAPSSRVSKGIKFVSD